MCDHHQGGPLPSDLYEEEPVLGTSMGQQQVKSMGPDADSMGPWSPLALCRTICQVLLSATGC
jgi:hypothetical protein